MALTAKQEKFCSCIADGMTQADAYRAAYNCARMKDKSIWERASKLMADAKVAPRVQELRAKLEKKQLWTREMSVKGLMNAYTVAKDAGQSAGMTGAIKELNLMHGYNEPQKIDHNFSNAIEIIRAAKP